MKWLIFLLFIFPLTAYSAPLFYENYENISLCKKEGSSCNWKYHNAGGEASSACSISTNISARGRKSLKCRTTYPNATRREIVLLGESKNSYYLNQDNEYWIGQSYFIPKWPADGDKGTVISQIHQRTDKCDKNWKFPFAITLKQGHLKVSIRSQKGTAACSNGYRENFVKLVHPIIVGEWFDMVINYLPDVHGNGKVKIWINNNLVVNYSGKVSYVNNKGDFWKHGLYRSVCADSKIACTIPTREIYFDEFKIAKGKNKFDEVNPQSSGGSPNKLTPPTKLKIINN